MSQGIRRWTRAMIVTNTLLFLGVLFLGAVVFCAALIIHGLTLGVLFHVPRVVEHFVAAGFTVALMTIVIHRFLNDGRFPWGDAFLAATGCALVSLGATLEITSFKLLDRPYFGATLMVVGAIAVIFGMLEPTSAGGIKKARDKFTRTSRNKRVV